MEFFGCTFIAFGPPFSLFLFTIARDPMRVIVLIASGFFWLLALLLSSMLWYAVLPLRDTLAFGLVCSVLIQETFRFVFYKVLRYLFILFAGKEERKANDGLQTMTQQNDNVDIRDFSNKHIMAYVSGLGFGITAGAFSIVNILADMSGPGSVGIQGDSPYFFWASSFLTLCFILLHTVWGVISFHALDQQRFAAVAGVVAAHMLVSCLSLINQSSSSDDSLVYLASLIPAYLVLGVCGTIAFTTAGGSIANLRKACVCRKGRYEID